MNNYRRAATALVLLLAAGAARAAGKPAGTVDSLGDPLPPGAVARLGTTRLRHPGFVQAIALSPDGTLLASAGFTAPVIVWDVATGKGRYRLAQTKDGARALAFAPDGKTLATGGMDGTVRLWDMATGKEQARVGSRLTGVVACLVFAQDGKSIFYAGNDTAIHEWDPLRGAEVRRWPAEGHVRCLALSPDGRVLVSGSGGELRLWDARTAKALATLTRPHEWVSGLAFAPDGRYLAAQYGTGRDPIYVWELASGAVALKITDYVYGEGLAYTPNGRALLTGIYPNAVQAWSAATGERAGVLTAPGTGILTALALSRDGKRVAGVTHRGSLLVWDRTTGKPLHAWPLHAEGARRIAFAPDGKTLATLADNGRVQLWDPASHRHLGTRGGRQAQARLLTFAAGGTVVAAGSGRDVGLWETASGRPVALPTRFADLVAFSPDGKTVAVAKYGMLQLWAGDKRPYASVRLSRPFVALTFAPDGKALATLDDNGVVRLHDPATGKEQKVLGAADARGRGRDRLKTGGLAYTPDGRRLVSAAGTATHVWDVPTAKEFGLLPATSGTPAVSPDGRLLALAHRDAIYLWEMATGSRCRVFKGHDGAVVDLAFAPDGRTLASAGTDQTVLFWDVTPPAGGKAALTPRDYATLWATLRDDPADKAFPAVGRLAASGAPAVAFLRPRLRPAAEPSAARLRKLLADLDGDTAAVRAAAGEELAGLGELAVPALRRALARRPALALRRQLEYLLESALREFPLPPESVRAMRAIHVLETIRSRQAREVLEALAKGAPASRITREAKAALRRMGRKPGG